VNFTFVVKSDVRQRVTFITYDMNCKIGRNN